MLSRPTRVSGDSKRSTWAGGGGIACLFTALFVTAGQYKGSPILSRLPDLTVAFGALVILACVARTASERGHIPKAFGSVALVYFLLTPGLAFVRSGFGIQQASQFFILTLLATAAPVLLLRSDRTVRYLIGPIALLGGYFAVLALSGKAASSLGRYSALSTNTIQTGRLIGFALIWVVVFTLGRRIPRLLGLSVSVALIVALVGTGSRGPLLTVVLAILLALLIAPRDGSRRLVTNGYRALVALIIVVALYAGYAYAPVYSRDRIFSVGSSGNGRLDMWRATIAAIPTHPLGVGYGGWPDWLQSTHPDLAYQLVGITHPHNLVLLALIEGGWIPGAALVWFLSRAMRTALRTATSATGVIILALLIEYILNSLVSDDLNDARTTFLLCGVALARAGWATTRNQPKQFEAIFGAVSSTPNVSPVRSKPSPQGASRTHSSSIELSTAWQRALAPDGVDSSHQSRENSANRRPRLERALRAIMILGGSTALGQLLLVAVTPVVTRLYTPAAIGLFTLYFTYVTFVQTGSSLMYSTAIPTARSDAEARTLTRVSLALSVPYAILGATAFFFLRARDIFGFSHFPLVAALLCVVSLALTGAFTTFRYLLVRQREYRGIARALLGQNGVRAIGQVGGGLLSATWWTMALSDVIGRLLGILPGLRLLRAQTLSEPAFPIRAVVRRYRSFPLVYLPSILIDNFVVWLPLPLITAHFGLAAGGYFAIVSRVVGLPLGVIAASVADVFHGELAQAARSGQATHHLFKRTAALLTVIGVPLALLLFFIGRPVLVTVLGTQWTQAGALCRVMAPWFLLQFIVSPLSRVVLVYEAQAWKLGYDALALGATYATYVVGVARHLSLVNFVGWLSIVSAGSYVVYFVILIWVIRKRGATNCAE